MNRFSPKSLWQGVVMLVLWRTGALRRRRGSARGDGSGGGDGEHGREDGSVQPAPAWAERLVSALLAGAALAFVAFAALFVLDPDTQLLGLALACALGLLAAALVQAGRRLVPQHTEVEPRPRHGDRDAVRDVHEEARAAIARITRRRLLAGAGGVAGMGLVAAAAAPLAALGPGLEDQLSATPWHAGRRLVDVNNRPILAADVLRGSFLTAFAEGSDHDDIAAVVVVVRVDPATLRLPQARARWAPKGILAYSKICTHAACAISLFRSPLSPTTESGGPALVCPCHYSTFDVLDGGSVEFGPAGRPLPQLPLAIDRAGALRAGGPMSGPIGPSWWGDPQ